MLKIHVRKVSWPCQNPSTHFYSKSNFSIFHQLWYRNQKIWPQKWVSHWFLTKKKLYPKMSSIAKVIIKKRIFSTFGFIFKSENLVRNNIILFRPNQTRPFHKGQQLLAVYIVQFPIVSLAVGEWGLALVLFNETEGFSRMELSALNAPWVLLELKRWRLRAPDKLGLDGQTNEWVSSLNQTSTAKFLWAAQMKKGTACKLRKLHASSCNCMQAYVTACKLM